VGNIMTRDELKEQIANLVVGPPMDCHITDGYWLADQISVLLEGWKSPEEVEKIIEDTLADKMHSFC
jgi:hypothetical protein